MIEWLIQQQVVVSATVMVVALITYTGSDFISGRLSYWLWVLVPLLLILNNIPLPVAALDNHELSRYVVGISADVVSANSYFLSYLYSSGASLLIAYFLYQHWVFKRALTQSVAVAESTYLTHKVDSPILYGVIRPKVLLPKHFHSSFDAQQQSLILQHEHTHIQHRDHLWNGLALIVVTCFWFNPLVWLGLRAFRLSQERACDESVLHRATVKEKLAYAKALVLCAERASFRGNPYPSFGGKTIMIKRLNGLQSFRITTKPMIGAAITAAALLIGNTALAKLPVDSMPKAEVNEAHPVQRVDPVYPDAAVAHGVEGAVVLRFDITEQGNTANIEVVSSQPLAVFDDSAKQALAQWKYKPRIQGGKAQRQTGLLVQLDYRMGPETEPAKTK